MSEIQLCIIVFYFGVFAGFLLKTWFVRRAKVSGTIFVTHDQEKTLYSLELNDYPESIEFKKHVVFKINASEESLNRE